MTRLQPPLRTVAWMDSLGLSQRLDRLDDPLGFPGMRHADLGPDYYERRRGIRCLWRESQP